MFKPIRTCCFLQAKASKMNSFNGIVNVKNRIQTTSSSAIPFTPGSERVGLSLPRPNANVIVDKHVWTKEESEMLLDMYEANRESFKNPGIRKIGVWANIARVINLKFGSEFSAQQCHQKLRNFKNDFHKVMMLEKKDCRHFERLHRLFLQSAAKPSQSPAALKRKLTQLAGSKPGNTNGPPNEKKLCSSYPTSTSYAILSGLNSSKQKSTVSTKSCTENSSIERRKTIQANQHMGVTKFPSQVAYLEQSMTSFPSSSATFPVKTSTYHGQSTQTASSEKVPTSSVSLNVASGDNTKESVACCSKTNEQLQKKDRPLVNLLHKPSQEIILDKSDIERILQNGESQKSENGLPVPVYYFSNKDPNKVLMGHGQDASVDINDTKNQSTRQTSSQNNATDRSIKKTPLEVFKTLFDTTDKRKSSKFNSSDEAHVRITENNKQLRVDQLQKAANADVSKLVEIIEKWRNESSEREAARIIREKERDNRLEEMHQENIKLTSHFIEIFETILAKINSSS